MNEPLAVELANTLSGGPSGLVDALADRGEAEWVADAAARWALPPGEWPRVRPLRDAVRALLEAAIAGVDPDQRDVDVVNQAARAMSPSLAWRRGEPPALDRGPGQILALTATSAISILAGPDRALLRRCDAAPCIRLFLADEPRRRYCSATCGTRVRAARLRQRRAAAPPPPA